MFVAVEREEKIIANWINREIVEMQLKRQMFALRGALST
jgi:hypothetical protein